MAADAVEDYTDLSFYAVRISSCSELMLYTAAIVHSLFENGILRSGNLTEEGFIPWDEHDAGVVGRILDG